jgi:hypothetical protein
MADHERFKELCALADTDSLSFRERIDLERHLEACAPCRELRDQYAAIGREGMAFLAQGEELTDEAARWDNRAAREKLFSSIRAQQSHKVLSIMDIPPAPKSSPSRLVATKRMVIAAVAACLLVAVGLGAYRIGERKNIASASLPVRSVPGRETATEDKPTPSDLLASQTAQIARMEQEISRKDQELAQLSSGSEIADARVSDLENLNKQQQESLSQLTTERDKLASEISEIESAYQKLQTDFTALKADHSRSLLHVASLESDITSLTTLNRDQERRLKDDEQYLVSDRDIRELMGARKLYIADVFDVDSASRTRKPFGRVFYTQNKSLVFYAFDLDHQPGIKNASDFQVWGQRDSESNRAPHPMNLGILYMDSESNRRWVLRSDNPTQLAEIDAVFVTVEPHGGSQKPTGKPLLYALLRKEANHP